MPIADLAAVAKLKTMLRGRLLQPGDEGYDAMRRLIWNGMSDCRPTVIAQCQGAADVVAAADFVEAGLSLTGRDDTMQTTRNI